MQDSPVKISVIVPVGPKDLAWQDLLARIPTLPADWELIFSMAVPPASEKWTNLLALRKLKGNQITWLKAEQPGRGAQLNQAGKKANGKWLWFLHADSLVSEVHFRGLQNLLRDDARRALYYFDLSFEHGKLNLVRLNQWGANLRSRLLKMPFGDQGFFIPRDLWLSLGCFEEGRSYGEDHALVWKCHHQGIPVLNLGFKLGTSPRKYHQNGWLRTTLQHHYLTWRQAGPELFRLVKIKVRKNLCD